MKRSKSAALIILLTARIAGAGTDPIAMIEARVGPPPDPDPIMETVRTQFAREGFAVTRTAIDDAFGGRLPAPAIEDPALSALAALQELDEGFQLYVNADYARAEAKLESALRGARRNPALLASDSKNLEPIFRAMSALALSQKRLKKTEAKLATFRELIRAFPNRPLSRDDFGPADIDDYKAVAKATSAQPRGELRIDVDDPRVEVFVDGQMRGMGKVELADLVPGVYRVFLRTSSRSELGRTYAIEVRPGGEARLGVSWQVDSRVWIRGPAMALELASDGELRDIAGDASVLASWTQPGMICVVERVQVAGKPALDGTLYRTDRVAVRHHRVMLDGDLAARADELARALRDGTPPEPLAVASTSRRARVVAPPASHSTAALAAGLALMTGGMAIDATTYASGAETHTALERAALASFAVGAALAGTGMYLHARAARADRVTAAAAGIGIGLLFAGTFALVTSQDPSPAFPADGLAIAGVAAAGAGAAALGASLWRSARSPALIVVSQQHGAVVGVAGAF